jgi:peptidase YpeB-like protein
LALAFVVARSCQQAQVRLTKEQAIERAEREVDFTPTRTVVRLLRQGLGSKPFWIVSLSIPRRDDEGYRRLAVVRIDANTGKVTEVTAGRGR